MNPFFSLLLQTGCLLSCNEVLSDEFISLLAYSFYVEVFPASYAKQHNTIHQSMTNPRCKVALAPKNFTAEHGIFSSNFIMTVARVTAILHCFCHSLNRILKNGEVSSGTFQ